MAKHTDTYKNNLIKALLPIAKPGVVQQALSMWEKGELQMISKPGEILPVSDIGYFLFVIANCSEDNFEKELNSIHRDSQKDGLRKGWFKPDPGSVAVTYRLILALQMIAADDLGEDAPLKDLQELRICRTGISTRYKNWKASLGTMKANAASIGGKNLRNLLDFLMKNGKAYL